MPIQLNARLLADFDRPIDVLEDCHRRIEHFLAMLQAVAVDATSDGRMTEEAAQTLVAALRYFRNAAPKHTADEEESLFPRMRATGDARVEPMLQQLERLERDHDEAEQLHDVVEQLGERWLATGTLDADALAQLGDALTRLRDIYVDHIRVEDELVFPLARDVLDADAVRELGAEMRARRPGAAAATE